MTSDELNALDALCAAATPGPWSSASQREDGATFDWYWVEAPTNGNVTSDHLDMDDATFIAAARTALPALIAEVRRLRDMVADLTTWRDRHDDVKQACQRAEAAEADRNRLRAALSEARSNMGHSMSATAGAGCVYACVACRIDAALKEP